MPKIAYEKKRFGEAALKMISTCNEIISKYSAQGFSLTLRQLYYQLVSRDIIPNSLRSYKNLGSVVNDGRMCGRIDWNAIEDRTRFTRERSHWDEGPQSIVKSCAAQFHMSMWADQEYWPEVWIEKDALVGVIEGVCQELDVPFLSCRGYTSQSEMWGSAQRLKRAWQRGKKPFLIHLGDHDPSGKDMTRDIRDRLATFMGGCDVKRIALNMEQVEQYNPPPNPAKITDSRARAYIAEFGNESWELDALEPAVISDLIRTSIEPLIDREAWDARQAEILKGRSQLEFLASKWSNVVDRME